LGAGYAIIMSNFQKPFSGDKNPLPKEPDLKTQSSETTDAAAKTTEADSVGIENDANRAVALVRSVFVRIGVSPIAYNEQGKAHFHPELARELEKPGNEGIIELLKSRFASIRNQS